MKHAQKGTRRKKGKGNEDGFQEEIIGQDEKEEEEEDTQGEEADNNKANNDYPKAFGTVSDH